MRRVEQDDAEDATRREQGDDPRLVAQPAVPALTVRLRHGVTGHYWLATPPDHDGSACAICQRGAAAIVAEFEDAESKGGFYKAVLRRGGHFTSERAPDWRRHARVRQAASALGEPRGDPDPARGSAPVRLATPATGPRWSGPAGRHGGALRRALAAATVWGATALVVVGAFSALPGPARAATPGSQPFNPCSPHWTPAFAPVTTGVDQDGHAASSATAGTLLCVEASVQVVGTAEPNAPVPTTNVPSSDFTMYVGRTSDPAIRPLLAPDFAAGSGFIVVVSDL